MSDPLPLPSPELLALEKVPSSGNGVLVLGVVQTGNETCELAIAGQSIDSSIEQTVAKLIESGDITGKQGESMLVACSSDVASLVVVIGLGKNTEPQRGNLVQFAGTAIRTLASKSRDCVTFVIGAEMDAANHDAIVAGALSGCEGQHIYHSDPSFHVPKKIAFAGISSEQVTRGEQIGQSIILTRRLVNEPPTIMNPGEFALRAETLANQTGMDCEIWDEHRLEEEGCRAILAVGRGSSSPPRLVILKHNGGGHEAPLVLVGKGVTFDSGGLSIKPSEGMVDMKCDMAGAATVVGVMHAIAKLGVKRNVIGFCGLAENMISGDSYKLGDVIETRSGKTIEILNTDAEGRVVLADTLDVAVQHEPAAIVDLATLTGACMVALGNEVAGLMTNNQSVCDQVSAAAGEEDEPVWQLPMFSLYDEKVKSKVADIRNIGEGRWGGAITAAKFLENFVSDVPWVHIDIAGPAFVDSSKPYRDAGATGVMVRTLVRWVEDQAGS